MAIKPDIPGHLGRSQGPSGLAGQAGQAEALIHSRLRFRVAWVAAMGVRKAITVGWESIRA